MQSAAQAWAQTAIVERNIGKVGASGQAKKNRKGTFFLLLALVLVSCANGDRDIVFSGPVTPVAGTCDPPTTGALTMRHNAVIFAPDTGILVLHGNATADGHISAALALQGVDHKPYHLSLDASRTASLILGTYITPRCHYRVTLHQSVD